MIKNLKNDILIFLDGEIIMNIISYFKINNYDYEFGIILIEFNEGREIGK